MDAALWFGSSVIKKEGANIISEVWSMKQVCVFRAKAARLASLIPRTREMPYKYSLYREVKWNADSTI